MAWTPDHDRGGRGSRGIAFADRKESAPRFGDGSQPTGAPEGIGAPDGPAHLDSTGADLAESGTICAPAGPVAPAQVHEVGRDEDSLAEAVEERAAIREFDGGLDRDLAEDFAYLDICRAWGLGCPPGSRGIETSYKGPPTHLPERRHDAPRPGHEDADLFLAWVLDTSITTPAPTQSSRVETWDGWQTDPAWWAMLKALAE